MLLLADMRGGSVGTGKDICSRRLGRVPESELDVRCYFLDASVVRVCSIPGQLSVWIVEYVTMMGDVDVFVFVFQVKGRPVKVSRVRCVS